MNAKHQFKYTYADTNLPEYSPVDVTFDMPGDVTITQMLWNFECYLKACGFVFDGHFEIVPEESYDLKKDFNEWINSDTSCCMSDTDTISTDPEVNKNKWVHGFCNPKAPDYKNGKDSWDY
jgi:hypothetical protein